MSHPTRAILSLGGGWQSSALALMACVGEIEKPDAIVFADTQREMPGTYEYLAFLRAECEVSGIPLITVTAGDLRADLVARQGKGMQPNLPVRTVDEDGKVARVNRYRCSFDYKRRVVTREAKRLCGPPGAWKRSTVEQWIGYTIDEVSRMKPSDECRCGHKLSRAATRTTAFLQIHSKNGCARCDCERFDSWQVNRWPLIERRMTRQDCQRWIINHGFPSPPRSACYFCPNRGNSHWRDLRDNHPDLWADTINLDEFVRHGMNEMHAEGFIHQSAVPLSVADLRSRVQRASEDDGQDALFLDEADTDCDAGVCFT